MADDATEMRAKRQALLTAARHRTSDIILAEARRRTGVLRDATKGPMGPEVDGAEALRQLEEF